jgi:hypothetical protein
VARAAFPFGMLSFVAVGATFGRLVLLDRTGARVVCIVVGDGEGDMLSIRTVLKPVDARPLVLGALVESLDRRL